MGKWVNGGGDSEGGHGASIFYLNFAFSQNFSAICFCFPIFFVPLPKV